MTEPTLPTASSMTTPITEAKIAKKRKKVRSVWIAFVGRIVAQFVGSAATIVLGLMLLNKYQTPQSHTVVEKGVIEDSRVLPTRSVRVVDDLSLAVLPLLNFSPDATQQYIADSMTEILTANLAQVPRFHVVSRTSAMNFKGQQVSVTDIASALAVRYIVEGSAAETDGSVRITVQLIDAARDEHVWARSYERRAQNILAVEEDVAAAIVRDLTTAILDKGDVAISTGGSAEAADRSTLVHRLPSTVRITK